MVAQKLGNACQVGNESQAPCTQRCLPLAAYHAMNLSTENCWKILHWKWHERQITRNMVCSDTTWQFTIRSAGLALLPTYWQFCSSRHSVETKQCCATNECGTSSQRRSDTWGTATAARVPQSNSPRPLCRYHRPMRWRRWHQVWSRPT